MSTDTQLHAPPRDFDEDAGSFDIRRLLAAVRKHKWVIAATVAIVVTGAVLYTMRLPKIYQATASVIIDARPPEVLGEDVQEVVQLTGEYNNTQVEIVTSRELTRMAVVGYDLHRNPKIVGDAAGRDEKARIELATNVVRGAISVKRPRDSRIMRIVALHTDPEVAAQIANALVDTYIQYSLNLRTEGTGTASKWLSGELDTAEDELRKSETELYDYKLDTGIVSIEHHRERIAANIAMSEQSLHAARSKRIELGIRRARVRAAAEVDVLVSPIFTLTGNATGATLRQSYYEEELKLIELEAEVGPKHPLHQMQKRRLDEIRAALEQEASMSAHAMEEEYNAAVATEAAFVAEIERYKKEALELEPHGIKYEQLARKLANDKKTYELMLERLGDTNLIGRLKTVNIRPLDSALVPTSPTFPSMRRNVSFAAVLGMILGIGLAFVLDLLDRTVKSAEDVEQAVRAPMLGIIPIAAPEGEEDANRSRDLHVFEEPTSRVAECCRSIRTNLLFMAADRAFKTLTVSSANPREGKTMSVIYLATTMAQSGQRVLVVDTDMRRPRLHESLGVSRQQGLSNLILGDVAADDVIKTSEIPNLYVLPCGPTPPNPAELLMTERFRNLLRELEGKFDRILLDSPPLLAVTDAVVLSRVSDGTILVLRAGKTNRDEASRAARALRDVNSRIVGVILNELDLEDRSYGYYYHYYRYGYGYGGKDAKAEAEPST